MATELATAYVQIIPSTKGIKGQLQESLGGAAAVAGDSAGATMGNKLLGKFGGIIKGAGKIVSGAMAAGVAGVAALTKSSLDAYADFEQLAGGVETLFKDSADTVMEYADVAYQSAGLSANEYMETVTSFSASLLQGLGGDTKLAADVANQAIIDMSDNANKMGTDMASIQNAYQGFAKQNYTMLDNLNLGFAGTKEGMQRLLAEAEKLQKEKFDVDVDYDIDNFSDIISAIHTIQEEMDIAGTTANEAATTIQGSLGMMKSAWTNLVTGLGDENADLGGLIDNFIGSVSTVGENIFPAVETILAGIGEMVATMLPQVIQMIPGLIDSVLPGIIESASDLVTTLCTAIIDNAPALIESALELIFTLTDALLQNLPALIECGLEAIVQLALGIADALPTLIPTVIDVVLSIVEYLIDNVDLLIDAAIALVMGLADGIINALPALIEKAPEIVMKLMLAVIKNAPKLLQAAIELILTLAKGIVQSYGKIFELGAQLVERVKGGFSQEVQQAKDWGRDLIMNFINGITERWNDLKQAVSNVAQTVKDFLGFSEPEKGPLSNFHTYGPDMMILLADGIKSGRHIVTSALNEVGTEMIDSLFDVPSVAGIESIVSTQETNLSGMQSQRHEVSMESLIDVLGRVSVVMDGNKVGRLVAVPVSDAIGQMTLRRV